MPTLHERWPYSTRILPLLFPDIPKLIENGLWYSGQTNGIGRVNGDCKH